MKLLIIYGSTEGHTAKIAQFLKAEAEKADHQVTLSLATRNTLSPEGFDGIIIGASVHGGMYQKEIVEYISRYASILRTVPSAFLSVSLTAAGRDPQALKELEDITREVLTTAGWKPEMIQYVAGALLYSKYGFFKKLIMRYMAKKSGGIPI